MAVMRSRKFLVVGSTGWTDRPAAAREVRIMLEQDWAGAVCLHTGGPPIVVEFARSWTFAGQRTSRVQDARRALTDPDVGMVIAFLQDDDRRPEQVMRAALLAGWPPVVVNRAKAGEPATTGPPWRR